MINPFEEFDKYDVGNEPWKEAESFEDLGIQWNDFGGSSTVVNKDENDEKNFERFLGKSEKAKKQIKNQPSEKDKDLARNIMEDVWTLFNNPNSNFKESKEVRITRDIIRKILELATETDTFKKIHNKTKNNFAKSSVACVMLSEEFIERMKNNKDFSNMLSLEDEMRNIALKKAEARKKRDWSLLNDLQKEFDSKQKKFLKHKKKILDIINDIVQEVEQSLENILGEIDELFCAMDAVSQLAGKQEGQYQRTDISKALEIAEKLQDKRIRKIMNLAGQMTSIAMDRQKKKVKYIPEETVDIEMGDNLQNLVPSEIIFFSKARYYFYQKYFEKRLLCYKKEGTEKVKRGPVIFILDESGSMYPNREIFAKAYFIAMQKIAMNEKRDIAYVPFSDKVINKYVFPQADIPIDALIDLLSDVFGHGGTSFDNAFASGMAELEKHEFQKADIVFLTDGEDKFSDKMKEKIIKLREKGVDIYSVLFGEEHYYDRKELAELSTMVIEVDYDNFNLAYDIFGTI